MKSYKNTRLYNTIKCNHPNTDEEGLAWLYRNHKEYRQEIINKIACSILYSMLGVVSIFGVASLVSMFINFVIL